MLRLVRCGADGGEGDEGSGSDGGGGEGGCDEGSCDEGGAARAAQRRAFGVLGGGRAKEPRAVYVYKPTKMRAVPSRDTFLQNGSYGKFYILACLTEGEGPRPRDACGAPERGCPDNKSLKRAI